MRTLSNQQTKEVHYVSDPNNQHVDTLYRMHVIELKRIAMAGDVHQYQQTVWGQINQYQRLALERGSAAFACRLAIKNLATRAIRTYVALFREVVNAMAASGLKNYSSMLMAGASQLTDGLVEQQPADTLSQTPGEGGDGLSFNGRKENLGSYVAYIQELQAKAV